MSETKKNNKVMTLPYTMLALIALAMIVSGCEQYHPTSVTENRIQVEEEKFTDSVPVSQMNDAAMETLAKHYSKHGDGPLELTVTYDPKATKSGAMHASDEAAKLSKALRLKGVDHVEAGILPVKDAGTEMNVMLAYSAYYAKPPKDCTLIAGLENQGVEVEEDYKLGCTRETLFARQIARPKDLKGQESGLENGDGRRLANSLGYYRDGVPNEPLEGEQATE